MVDVQHDWIGTDMEAKGERWETLQARTTPEEKRDIFVHCKTVIRLPYSVVTRLIWRKILHNHRIMPNVRHDEMTEVNNVVDEVMVYVPMIRRQRHYAPRQF